MSSLRRSGKTALLGNLALALPLLPIDILYEPA
jgi:hypothetical protein